MKQTTFLILTLIGLLTFLACKNQSGEKINYDNSNTIKRIDSLRADTTIYVDNSIEIKDYDTIIKEGIKIYFTQISEADFNPYYIDQEERNRIIKNLDNSHEKAIAIENYLTQQFRDYFSTTDSTLTLFLENNEKIILPKWDKELDLGYNFENYFPQTNYILLYVQYYEGNGWMLVNRKNGFKRFMHGQPYFSPDNKSILTASVDLEADYSFNGIEYYKLQNDTLTKILELKIKDWGPEKIKWTSNSSAVIAKTFWTFENNQIIYHTKYTTMTIDQQ